MAGNAQCPLLFLDVDGPLIPFGGSGQYPQLAVVDFPEDPRTEEQDGRAGRHWRTRALVNRASGRPFA